MRQCLTLIAVLFLTILSNCTQQTKEPAQQTAKPPKQWYEGGTLHKAKIRDWKAATDENKLATCADFAAHVNKSVSMQVLKQRAIDIRACINEATRGLSTTDEMQISEVAAMCIVTLGYQ